MSNDIFKVVYFANSGPQNTDETLKYVKERAEKLSIQNIVVPSYTGATGVKASEVFKDYNLVVVAGVFGFKEPNTLRLIPENRSIIERNGGKIVIATHAFGTLGRAVHRRFGAIQVDEVIANVLRVFCQGVKVSCEVACMAVDAGLIRTDEEAICTGGTGRGIDTAIVLKPSNTHTFFEMRVKEIICKPR
jgi:hypothetical protein